MRWDEVRYTHTYLRKKQRTRIDGNVHNSHSVWVQQKNNWMFTVWLRAQIHFACTQRTVVWWLMASSILFSCLFSFIHFHMWLLLILSPCPVPTKTSRLPVSIAKECIIMCVVRERSTYFILAATISQPHTERELPTRHTNYTWYNLSPIESHKYHC